MIIPKHNYQQISPSQSIKLAHVLDISSIMESINPDTAVTCICGNFNQVVFAVMNFLMLCLVAIQPQHQLTDRHIRTKNTIDY